MKSKKLQPPDFTQKLSKFMVQETFRILEFQEKEKGIEFYRVLSQQYLAKMIAAIVFKSLKDRPEHIKNNEEMADYSVKNFKDLKNEIQEAVAQGFQGAMSTYSGNHVEYYCQIKILPETKNPGMVC